MRYTDAQIEGLYRRLQLAAAQTPDIANAAIASSLPFYSTYAMRVRVPGRDSLPRVADGGPYYRVVVINESLARLWWPSGNAIGRADPSLPYVRVRPLEQLIAPQTQSWRLGARMFSSFGVLSLLLAAVGLYGMLSYDVSQRRHELGVRVAFGASMTQLARSVINQGMQSLLAGVALGLMLALAGGGFVERLLFQTSSRDPGVLTGVVAVLAVVGLAAMLVPTIRATRADPLSALRSE